MPVTPDEIKSGYSVASLALELNRSEGSIRRLIRLRRIESILVGGKYVITQRALTDYLERNRHRTAG